MTGVLDPEGAELAALAEVADFSGLRVLDVGCGEGRLVWKIADVAAFVLGVDTEEDRIETARASVPVELAEKVRFRLVDVCDLDEPDESFDAAFLTWSL